MDAPVFVCFLFWRNCKRKSVNEKILVPPESYDIGYCEGAQVLLFVRVKDQVIVLMRRLFASEGTGDMQ